MASIENETHEGAERKFTTQRTARFMTLGQADATTREVWVVFHGYGQLVRYFIRHFRPIDDSSRFILAPEGLSRFYLGDGEFQRVGATWMTKESRLDEIDDQRRFLNQLFAQETRHVDWRKTKLVLFGFSQGVATAWRWLLQGDLPVPVSALVAWAGMPPQELDGMDKYPNLDIYAAWGDQDPYVTPERAEMLTALLEAAERPVHRFPFFGQHTMDTDTLLDIADAIGAKSK